jgi:predicted amidohydrolase YtcJ
MCIVCSPELSNAFRALSFKSRRQFLIGAAALSTGAFVAEAVAGPAQADGAMNQTLAAGLAKPPATIFVANKIITMERDQPTATAVAVSGQTIIAAGSLDEVKAALGTTAYRIDETFADKVLLPGFIDQHLHPILGALTLAVEVIAPEDWVLPGRTIKAASSQDQYRGRLQAAIAASNPKEWFFTWGYHALWHGPLSRADLNALSATQPIAVWQRSCHEFYLNDAAIAALGITEEATRGKGEWSAQVDFANGHFWEGGLNFIITPMMKVLASPERLTFGLKQMVGYLHANGVTAYNEPGALYTPDMWTLYEQILGAPSTPMYATFLADGRGIIDRVGLDNGLKAVEQQIAVAPAAPGKKVMFFDKQIKFFADGAIISQLMQMKDGYLDGHKGEWIMPPDQLEQRMRLFWNAGYQIHIHVNGDLGLEVLLDIIEKLMTENPRQDHRTVIVHFANSSEDQVARIARLGAIVSANPYYPVGFADKYAKVGLGPERADVMVRAASVLKHKIPFSYHSDLPMGPAAPLVLASYGVNRVTPSGRVAGPEQRISVDDALRAITIGAAYSWRQETRLGSIAPGKIANFTVLGQDPYAVDPLKLHDVPIWGTVFEGTVYPVARG